MCWMRRSVRRVPSPPRRGRGRTSAWGTPGRYLGRGGCGGPKPGGLGADASLGPWDVTATCPERERIDLGSLQVPTAPGLDVQVNFTGDQALAVIVVRGDSMLQLQAFAAPKRAGLWDDIRRELIDELNAAGGRGEEAEGPFGPEVMARVPAEPGAGSRVGTAARQVSRRGWAALVPARRDQRACRRPSGAGEGTRGRLRGHRGRPRRASDASAGSARTAPARRGAAGAGGADGPGGGRARERIR